MESVSVKLDIPTSTIIIIVFKNVLGMNKEINMVYAIAKMDIIEMSMVSVS